MNSQHTCKNLNGDISQNNTRTANEQKIGKRQEVQLQKRFNNEQTNVES